MKNRISDKTSTEHIPPNAPLPMDIFLEELRRAYRTAYLDHAVYQERSIASLRTDLEMDVDYDPATDCLYLWFEDPTITTPAGDTFAAACLTSYPDMLTDVSATAPKAVLAWVRMRAAAHCNYDAVILQYNSSTLLKPKLMFGVRYVPPPAQETDEKGRHGIKDEEIF